MYQINFQIIDEVISDNHFIIYLNFFVILIFSVRSGFSSFSSKAILLPLSCLLVGVITLGKWKPLKILHPLKQKQKKFLEYIVL